MPKSTGKIELKLFRRSNDKGDYFVGDFGDAPVTVDLSKVTIFVFSDKNPDTKTILIREKNNKTNSQ